MRICVVINSITGIGGFEKEIWEGICDAAQNRSANIFVFCGGELGMSPTSEFDKYRNFIYDMINPDDYDGFVIVGGTLANRISDEEFLVFLKKFTSKPCISAAPCHKHIPEVITDNASGIRLILEHLIKEHHIVEFGYVSGSEGNTDAQVRYDAFRNILKDNGLDFFDNYFFQGDWTNESGKKAAEFFLEDGGELPKAIVCANDNMALGVLDEFADRGINVPADVAVTGFDDIEDSTAILPALTTVRQNVYELGRAALEQMVDLLSGKGILHDEKISCNLMIRQSCGCMLNVMKRDYGSMNSAGLDDHDGDGIKRKIFEKVKLALSGLQRVPPDELIIKAIGSLGEIIRGNQSPFLIDFENCLRWSFYQNETITVWQNIVSVFVRTVEKTVDDPVRRQELSDLFHQSRIMIAEIAVQMQKRQRRMMMNRNEQIITIGSNVSTSFTFMDLNDNLSSLIPRINVPSVFISIFPENRNQRTRVILRSAFTSDLRISENCISEEYLAVQILPEKYKNLEENKSILIFPIIFRTNQMGFCVFGMGTRDGMIYENMVLQLSNTVQRIQLLEHIQITEADLLRKNQKIEDLITPMLNAFLSIREEAMKESVAINELIQVSKDNIATIEKAVAISGILEKALSSASDLVHGIDDISETVNLVALNASIEAAHAGTFGRGFKVIANEIRKLSSASRINADNIGKFLSEIDGGVMEFVSTIGETRLTFDHLMKVISETADSFKYIAEKMDRLTGNSDAVLITMKE